MTNPTPTTQPPAVPDALIAKWREDAPHYRDGGALREMTLIQTASAWGWTQREPEIQAAADQELEACCRHLELLYLPHGYITGLRKVRRPSPPTLREQALAALERGCFPQQEDIDLIRQALTQTEE